jgi:preprotein translocase subunit SecE
VARDRRRAKQRRDRQARAAGGAQTRRDEGRATPTAPAPEVEPERTHDPAEPPELASGELDIADAQLALGRPELIDATQPSREDLAGSAGEADVQSDEAAFEELEDRVDAAEEAFEEGASYEEEEDIARPGNGHVAEGAELVRDRGGAPARGAEPREGNRLATFLRGSWRELQRVQWPDRRQVGQATAVVIGFVIVAGAYLGLADYVAGKIVDLII